MRLIEAARLAYRVSRPRFWFYLLGPYTVGCIWGAETYLDLLNPAFFAYFLFFMFPANVLLYGVNDLYDYETDLLNPKKDEKEYRMNPAEREALRRTLALVLGVSLLLALSQRDNVERLIFGGFLFLSVFYSARPLRFKQRPLLDSASNVLYAMPGVFAYYHVSGGFPPFAVLAAASLHTFAMHLFSAVPDVEYDTKTGIATTAVVLGGRSSMVLCLLAWSGVAAITILIGTGNPLSYLALIYPLAVAMLLVSGRGVDTVYWFYPYVNVGLGAVLFLVKAAATPWA